MRASTRLIVLGLAVAPVAAPAAAQEFRPPSGVKSNYWIMPELIYECGAFAEYWLRGKV